MSMRLCNISRCSAVGLNYDGKQALGNEPCLRSHAMVTDAVQGDPPDGRQVLSNEPCLRRHTVMTDAVQGDPS